ncbi:glycosyltransferase family 4 protein [soil metagenome]
MKVLFLSRLYLPHIGGVELHIQNLVKELGPEYEVTVVTEQHDPALPLSEKVGSIHVLRIPLPNQQTSKWKIWWWWLRHLSLIYSADVIHVHDVFFWLLPYKCIFFWKKMYITFHGYEGINNPRRIQKIWHQLAELLTEGNICIGGFHQKWYGVIPTITSFGAVRKSKKSSELLSGERVKQLLSPKKRIKIVFVGRLAADTGVLIYLEAVKILQDNYSVSLDIYGDGPQRMLVDAAVASYKLHATVHGFVESDEIQWQNYDVAFVSRYLSILESFIYELPVVSQYNVAIKKDYLCMSPFVDWIQVGQSVSEIVSGFEHVFKEESTQHIRLAHEWAKEQSWRKMAQDYKDLWHS